MTVSRQDLETLAKAYREGEDQIATPAARAMIAAEVQRIDNAFDELTKRIAVRFVAHDPYRSFEEMRDRVQGERMMLVWTGESDTPLWDPVTNWKARAVHDWDHIQHGLDFSMGGEAAAFHVSAARTPGLAPLYLSEIALQAAVFNFYKVFDPQKLVIPSRTQVERVARELQGLRGPRTTDPLMLVWFVYGLYERGATDKEVMMHLVTIGLKERPAIHIAAAGRELYEGRSAPRA